MKRSPQACGDAAEGHLTVAAQTPTAPTVSRMTVPAAEETALHDPSVASNFLLASYGCRFQDGTTSERSQESLGPARSSSPSSGTRPARSPPRFATVSWRS